MTEGEHDPREFMQALAGVQHERGHNMQPYLGGEHTTREVMHTFFEVMH